MTAPSLRDAATVMVVRDVGGTMQVLMLRRQLRSVFVGGAYVFPGGGVDPGDREPSLAAICTGRDDAEARRLLGLDPAAATLIGHSLGPAGDRQEQETADGLAYFVAAVRESFEEAGILLATGPDGPLRLDVPTTAARFDEHRRKLNAGETTFLRICVDEGLTLPMDRLCYFSHWITPEGAPRRYDTRFFVAILPDGQVALHDDAEVVASEWVSPAGALSRHRAGELDLMFPTIKHLEAIGQFGSSAELFAAASAAEVETVEPRITADEGGVRIVLPGDPRFSEATGLPSGVAFPDRPVEIDRA